MPGFVLGQGSWKEESPGSASPELSSAAFFDYPLTVIGSYFL